MIKEVTDVELDCIVSGSENPVIVDFYAPWCHTCQVLSPAFDRISDDYENCIFLKIDAGKYDSVADKYNILHLPTFMFFHKGKETGRTTSANTDVSLCSFIESKAGEL